MLGRHEQRYCSRVFRVWLMGLRKSEMAFDTSAAPCATTGLPRKVDSHGRSHHITCADGCLICWFNSGMTFYAVGQ